MGQESIEYLQKMLNELEQKCSHCNSKFHCIVAPHGPYCGTMWRIFSIKRVLIKRKERLGITT